MITSFTIETPSGPVQYQPSVIVNNRVIWTRETADRAAPIDTRALRINAKRREVIAAFRN